MAAVAGRVAAPDPRPLGVAVGKKRVGGGSQRLAADTLAGGATPFRVPYDECCTPPTAGTLEERTAEGGHHQKSDDGMGKWGSARDGLHWARLTEWGWCTRHVVGSRLPCRRKRKTSAKIIKCVSNARDRA